MDPRSRKQLAAWIRKRMEKSVDPELLAKISDDQLIAQHAAHTASMTKQIAEKTAVDKGKVQIEP